MKLIVEGKGVTLDPEKIKGEFDKLITDYEPYGLEIQRVVCYIDFIANGTPTEPTLNGEPIVRTVTLKKADTQDCDFEAERLLEKIFGSLDGEHKKGYIGLIQKGEFYKFFMRKQFFSNSEKNMMKKKNEKILFYYYVEDRYDIKENLQIKYADHIVEDNPRQYLMKLSREDIRAIKDYLKTNAIK